MKKIWYILLGLCIIQNRTTALNIECVNESIQSAIKESASLAAYQTAWHDISKFYLDAQQEIAPLIAYTLQEAQEYKALLEQQVTDTHHCCTSVEKKKMLCGTGMCLLSGYLASGIIALPLHTTNYIQSNTVMGVCFPVPVGIKQILLWLAVGKSPIGLGPTTIQWVGFGLTCAQWIASFPLATYFAYKGIKKINESLTYTDRLNNKISTLELIITYMQELQSDVPVTKQ